MSSTYGTGRDVPRRRYSVGTYRRARCPHQLLVVGVERRVRARGELQPVHDEVLDRGDGVARFRRVCAVALHQQHGLGIGGNQKLVPRIDLPGEAQVPAVHQVARPQLVRRKLRRRGGGVVQRVEEQQHARGEIGQRHRAQRGLGHQGQRALAADQQPGQVDAVAR